MIEQEKNPITRLGLKLLGPKLFKEYPYKEIYLLEHASAYARRCVARSSTSAVAQRARVPRRCCGRASTHPTRRTLLEDPDFVKHAQADPAYVNGCNHCNRCVGLIDHPDGIRCVVHDAA